MVNKTAIDCDVVVVGAGLVGLTAVVALAQQGRRVVLVDEKPKPVYQMQDWDARIYALTPATESFLKTIGVWDAVDLSRINPVHAMTLWHVDGDSSQQNPLNLLAEDANINQLACIAESSNLLQALWQQIDALAVPVVMGVPSHDLQYTDDKIVLVLDNHASIAARLLVAADSAHSFVRQHLAISTKVKDFNQLALVANYQIEKPHGNIAYQWFSSHETLALLPLPNQHVSMVWALARADAERLLMLKGAELALTLEKQIDYLLGSLKPVSQTFSFELRQVTARALIANRVVLIGDAAHQVHPMAGQGANLGFRDVIGLVDLIAHTHALQDIGDQAFLRGYERARKTDIAGMNVLTSGLDSLFATDSPLLKRMTAVGMR
ncbi:MAG: FAD-dependent monooxygenase, partial [Methylophilaceae bacterium]|nr:FAD-dependent monooxygenase [Methylophilaceae bacterium]